MPRIKLTFRSSNFLRKFGLDSSNKPSRSTKALYNFFIGANTKESIQGFVVGRCWYCDDTSHITHDCSKFKELTFKKLSKFVRTNRMCYKCFSRKHKTNDCKRNNLCKVKGCKGTFHYFLLHNYDSSRGISQASHNNKPSGNTIQIKDGESDSGTGVTQAVTCSQASDGVYLCVVPVKVMHGNKTVIAYTFLDQGLTH